MAAGLRHYKAAQRSLQGGHCVLNWILGRHLFENKIEHQSSSLVVLADPILLLFEGMGWDIVFSLRL